MGPRARSRPPPDCQNASPITPKLRAASNRRPNPAIAWFFEVSDRLAQRSLAHALSLAQGFDAHADSAVDVSDGFGSHEVGSSLVH